MIHDLNLGVEVSTAEFFATRLSARLPRKFLIEIFLGRFDMLQNISYAARIWTH